MLESLTIRNLGLISEAEIEFDRGLVVITGETGAGKTLLLEAISALAGKKPGLAGVNADTSVDAAVRLNPEAQAQAQEAGAELEQGMALISRVFPVEGRAKAVLGGRPVPSATLSTLADSWLAVHGQHDTLKLLRPSAHRDLLDRHGGPNLFEIRAHYREVYANWRRLVSELEAARAEQAQLLADIDSISADVNLCESLNLQPGEDAEIAATIDRLARAEQIRTAVQTALLALGADEGGAAADVGLAARELEHSIRGDSLIESVVSRLRSVQSELADVSSEIAELVDGLEIDPAALDALMLRQRQIKTLLLRHGPTLEDLFAWLENARRRLRLADPDGVALAELSAQVAAAEHALLAGASELSAARQKAAESLGAAVAGELKALAMPFARFEVSLTPTEPSESGADSVEFGFSANPGLPVQPIQHAASGGELSRLMLAIEVSIRHMDDESASVMVFDEVDAGVAGAAATAVAERLARLAAHRQVLVVSHLAQIAAFADQHLKVEKDSDGLVTSTTVQNVAAANRTLEVARMLAGVEGSASAQEHAKELLNSAQKMKEASHK